MNDKVFIVLLSALGESLYLFYGDVPVDEIAIEIQQPVCSELQLPFLPKAKSILLEDFTRH